MNTSFLIFGDQPMDVYPGNNRGGVGRVLLIDNVGGRELVEVVLGVLRYQTAKHKERIDAATWLTHRGFGKPAVNAAAQAPGIGDFTITIGDHDITGNPINDLPRD
jgi:hypothetical protein